MNEWFLVMHVLRSVAAHNDKFSTKSVCEIMVRNFSKVKVVFVHHIPNNKNLLQFMHRCYYVGDIQWYLEPTLKQSKIFIFFYCFSHFSARPFYNIWKVIFQNPRIFLLATSHITKTSFSLFTGVTNWDMWLDIYSWFWQI